MKPSPIPYFVFSQNILHIKIDIHVFLSLIRGYVVAPSEIIL